MNELAQYMTGRKAQGFNPHPYYSAEGDFVTYYFEDDDFIAHRVDPFLTVYLSMTEAGGNGGGQKLVGFKLKGVKHILRRLHSFSMEIRDNQGRMRLGLLFMAAFFESDDQAPWIHQYYRSLEDRTKDVAIDLPCEDFTANNEFQST